MWFWTVQWLSTISIRIRRTLFTCCFHKFLGLWTSTRWANPGPDFCSVRTWEGQLFQSFTNFSRSQIFSIPTHPRSQWNLKFFVHFFTKLLSLSDAFMRFFFQMQQIALPYGQWTKCCDATTSSIFTIWFIRSIIRRRHCWVLTTCSWFLLFAVGTGIIEQNFVFGIGRVRKGLGLSGGESVTLSKCCQLEIIPFSLSIEYIHKLKLSGPFFFTHLRHPHPRRLIRLSKSSHQFLLAEMQNGGIFTSQMPKWIHSAQFICLSTAKDNNCHIVIENVKFWKYFPMFCSVFVSLALGTGFVRFKETNNVRDHFGWVKQ